MRKGLFRSVPPHCVHGPMRRHHSHPFTHLALARLDEREAVGCGPRKRPLGLADDAPSCLPHAIATRDHHCLAEADCARLPARPPSPRWGSWPCGMGLLPPKPSRTASFCVSGRGVAPPHSSTSRETVVLDRISARRAHAHLAWPRRPRQPLARGRRPEALPHRVCASPAPRKRVNNASQLPIVGV